MVSKRRKKLADHIVRGAEPGPPPVRGAPDREHTAATVASILFVVLLGFYVWWFYRVSYGQNSDGVDVPRYTPLAYCLAPESLIEQWCGVPEGRVVISDRVPLLLLAGAVTVAGFLLGRLVLARSRIAQHLGRAEYLALATGLGFSGLSLVTLAVGLCGALQHPIIFVGIAVVIIVASLLQAWRRARRANVACAAVHHDETHDIERRPWWQPRAWWLALPFVLAIVAGALLPSVNFDALEYHLQVPREWVQTGRITYLPHNMYGNMPLGAEALVALTMALSPGELGWWWGALAGKLALAIFALLAALLLAGAGRRYISREAGVLAALLYLSTPWIAHVSISGLNEGALAFYMFAAIYAARLAWDCQRTDVAAARGGIWLSGWMAGAAAACKYTSVVLLVIPLFVLVAVLSRRERWRMAGTFVLSVALACGLWYAKTWVQTGNPVYPLLAPVFPAQPRTPAQVAQFQRAHQVPVDAAGRRYSLAQGWDALRLLAGASLWHSPLIVPLAALVALRRRILRQAAFWLGGFLVFAMLWWLVTHRVDRFVVPAWPLLAMTAAIGAAWSVSSVWRGTLWTVLICGLAANFAVVASPLIGLDYYLVSLDQLRSDPRLDGVSVAHQYLNSHVPPDQHVLMVGDAGVFDVQVPSIYNTCFDTCIFEEIMRGRDAAQRRARLKELRVSHLYVAWGEIARYRRPGNYGFTDYVTPQLLHGEMESEQHLIRAVPVPDLDTEVGEIFEVIP